MITWNFVKIVETYFSKQNVRSISINAWQSTGLAFLRTSKNKLEPKRVLDKLDYRFVV